jgi:hypothetical protein
VGRDYPASRSLIRDIPACKPPHSASHAPELSPQIAATHPPEVKAAALELVAQGLNDCEISRLLGIPRRTILDWRRPTYVPSNPQIPRETCPRCWRAAKPMRFTAEDYSELLGL